jgi:hypothetical protein
VSAVDDPPRLQDELDAYRRRADDAAGPGDITDSDAAAAEARHVSGLRLRPPRAGEPAPGFALPGVRGETIALTDLLDRGSVVLAFYRGVW